MKIYLIDDDASVCNILKIIIQQKKLGEVCGTASNMDGIHFVKRHGNSIRTSALSCSRRSAARR